MCGYIQRINNRARLEKTLQDSGLDELLPSFLANTATQHFYPAFGGNASRTLNQLIIGTESGPTSIDATWWFDCEEQGEDLRVGERTTFNARNLDSPFWKGALRHHRALVVATGIGESGFQQGKKQHYLMTGSDQAFLLGALYRPFNNGRYSCAVITRPASPGFAEYHEKAMPLFLPADKAVIAEWLDPSVADSPLIQATLEANGFHPTLEVTPVKTFKGAEPLGKTRRLREE